MVKFKLRGQSVQGRIGLIEFWGRHSIKHETPSCMIYLRAGHVPHLTWDVAHKCLKLEQSPIYQLTLPSLMETSEIIGKFGKGAASFCGMPDNCAVHLQILDPLDEVRSGYNNTKSIAVFTKGGRKMLNAENYREIIRSFMCDSFDTMFDYDAPRSCLNKRLLKGIERTKTFCDQLFEREDATQGMVLASLGGGFSDYHRRKFAVDFGSNDRWDGFSVDLHDFVYGKEVEQEELKRLVKESLDPLPTNRLRFVTGPFDPAMVLLLTRLGFDLFDSSFAIKMAEEGKALRLADDYIHSSHFELLDFCDDRFCDDYGKLFDTCDCYTCRNYTRMYLKHITNVKEMIGKTLLAIHNLSEYQRMFFLIRRAMDKADTA